METISVELIAPFLAAAGTLLPSPLPGRPRIDFYSLFANCSCNIYISFSYRSSPIDSIRDAFISPAKFSSSYINFKCALLWGVALPSAPELASDRVSTLAVDFCYTCTFFCFYFAACPSIRARKILNSSTETMALATELELAP